MEQKGILQSAEAETKQTGEVNYDELITDMETRLPPELKEAWDRIMAAGLKFLFDQKTNPMVNEYLEGDGEISEKLATGAAGLIAFLDKESRGALPKELIIPAGMAFLVEVAKYVTKSGMAELTVEQFGKAVNIYLEKVLGVYGATVDQMKQTYELAGKEAEQKQPEVMK